MCRFRNIYIISIFLLNTSAKAETSNCTLTREWVFRHLTCPNVQSVSSVNFVDAQSTDSLEIKNLNFSTITLTLLQNKFPHLSHLDMEDKGIEDIASEAFVGFQYLVTLNLQKNHIRKLPPKPFGKNIRNLDLSKNIITILHVEAFSGMNNLFELHLEHNNIGYLQQGLFKDCSRLNYLYLSHNVIDYIEPNVFDNAGRLRIIDLSYNKIPDIYSGMFLKLNKLWHLNLNYNNLKRVSNDWFSNGSLNINIFDAKNNEINVIEPNMFKNAKHLTSIDLSNNELSELNPNTFAKLDSLSWLDVSNNKLTVLPNNLLLNFPDLSYLIVAHNKINSIEPNAFVNSLHLNRLDISYNELSHIHNGSLCGAKELNVQHNYLTDEDIDSVFTQCKQLRFLQISDNKIKHLNKQSIQHSAITVLFSSNNQFQKLDLSVISKFVLANFGYNQIQTLHGNINEINQLETLNLQHNKIDKIELDTFLNFNKILVLVLNDNEIVNVSSGAFRHLKAQNVHGMYLLIANNKIKTFNKWFIGDSTVTYVNASRNIIEYVEDYSLEGAPFLKVLDLSYNEIASLPRNAFSGPNLESLYLHHNHLTTLSRNDICSYCPSLVTLDLSFNDDIRTIEPSAFENLNKTQFVHFRNNSYSNIITPF